MLLPHSPTPTPIPLTRSRLQLLVALNGWATPRHRCRSECVRLVCALPLPPPPFPPRLHASSVAHSAHCSPARTRSTGRCRRSVLCRARLGLSFHQSCSSPSRSRSPNVGACDATRARGEAAPLSRRQSSRRPPRRLPHLFQLVVLIAAIRLHRPPRGPSAIGSYSAARGVLLQVRSQSQAMRLLVLSASRPARLWYVYPCRRYVFLLVLLTVYHPYQLYTYTTIFFVHLQILFFTVINLWINESIICSLLIAHLKIKNSDHRNNTIHLPIQKYI